MRFKVVIKVTSFHETELEAKNFEEALTLSMGLVELASPQDPKDDEDRVKWTDSGDGSSKVEIQSIGAR